VFLTYVDDVMQNAILISPMAGEGAGYLMDLEFYGPDMPLGGLEYAIVNITEALRAEGCGVFSLGGTYGCKLADSPDADPELEKILDELRAQNIFNDAGNLQFKNKFRPETHDIFLCRAVDAGRADKRPRHHPHDRGPEGFTGRRQRRGRHADLRVVDDAGRRPGRFAGRAGDRIVDRAGGYGHGPRPPLAGAGGCRVQSAEPHVRPRRFRSQTDSWRS